MDRYRFLPSYHYVENEDGVINHPATNKLRTCTIYGNHGKNLIPYPFSNSTKTIKGVTFTDNGDGTITANGTATGNAEFIVISSAVTPVTVKANTKYTLSGTPSDGTYKKWYMYLTGLSAAQSDMGTSVTFAGDDTDKNVSLIVRVSQGAVADNVVFKPMLEEGETKTEFEPWCGVGDKTKNLIPYPYADTTKTINGVTFTDNGDGTITANGTATAVGASFLVFSNSNGLVGQGKYYLSGCPSNNYPAVSLQPKIDNEWHPDNYDFGEGKTITVQSTLTQISCDISSSNTVDNVTFRPFLAKADSATSYEPYGYKIELLNKPWNNLINVDDFDSTQTNGYYAGISTTLTDSNMSTYLPYLDEMKGKSVVFSCDLDNENFRKEFLIYYNVEVNGALKYIEFTQGKNFTVILPDATPIRIECRARSDSADMNGTTVKFSNITLKYEDIKEEKQNMYLKNQIMDGEEVSYKTDLLNDIILHKDMINDLSINSKIKPKKVSYSYYTYKYPNKNN